ncbi:hypothetical protein [Streptomyces carpinensis]|uniref:Ankyrin n=1 Tax=Streptomyces carpinensis TaxID=66369 RepID=A0ABV1W4S9_9ACTN|nr:hypothetical protein [Streptomyces carpinensis]
MNAERHRSDPARHFEGEFETHLTLAPQVGLDSDERIRGWAERHGLKYTRIVLDRGRTPDQPMLTCRGEGTLTGQVAAAHQWAERLRGDGFHVTRVKMEVAPWTTGVPRTDAEAAALPGDCYFEHHVKLLLSGERQVVAVRALAEPHTAHVSRNARRASADGTHERFVTQRCRGVGRREARRSLDALLRALAEAACTVVEVEEEFVVHDDNPSVDAGWIAGDSEAGPRAA